MNGQSQVFVVENGHAQLRKIEVGRDTGKEVEVLSGLGVGDAVIMRPPGSLLDGAEVATSTPAAKVAVHK